MPRFSVTTILSACAFLLMIGVGMIVALLPQRVYAASGTFESVGLIASVFALAYLLTQLPAGILADRFGAKPFLVAGYMLCGAAGLIFFFAQSVGVTYLGRAIQGIGEAPIWALGPAILSAACPDGRGRAIGSYNAAIHAGLMLGPLLGLAAAPDGRSALPFLIYAGLCFCAGLALFRFLPRPTRPIGAVGVRITWTSITRPLRTRRSSAILLGVFLYGAGYGLFVSVLPVSLTVTHDFGPGMIGALFVTFYAAIGAAQILAGPWSDRLGRDGFMAAGMLSAACGIGLFPLFPGGWAFLPLAVASVGLGVFCVASVAALTEAVSGVAAGTVSGAYYLFWATGYFLGPLLLGAVVGMAPVGSYAALALVMAVQATAAWRCRATSRRR